MRGWRAAAGLLTVVFFAGVTLGWHLQTLGRGLGEFWTSLSLRSAEGSKSINLSRRHLATPGPKARARQSLQPLAEVPAINSDHHGSHGIRTQHPERSRDPTAAELSRIEVFRRVVLLRLGSRRSIKGLAIITYEKAQTLARHRPDAQRGGDPDPAQPGRQACAAVAKKHDRGRAFFRQVESALERGDPECVA